MRPIPLVLLAAAFASPLSHGAGLDAHRIAWTKGAEKAPFRDQHGVCHVFSRDTKAALAALGTQVKACMEGALPQVVHEQGHTAAVKVAWNRADPDRVNQLYARSSPQNALLATSARRRPAPLPTIRGFFVQAGDTCHVVVPDRPDYVGTLGHEFKHCVDGLFHDERGEWLRGDDAV